jgi:hypothetical protein
MSATSIGIAPGPRGLISIKAPPNSPSTILRSNGGGLAMPTETLIVVALIVAAFAVFSVTLLWADHTTRKHGED